MTLSDTEIHTLATHLEAAERHRKPVAQITDDYPDLDMQDAYAIQTAIREIKIAGGHVVVGLKMGLTSYAKMKQMQVDTPISGFLMDYGSYPNGAEIDAAAFIHPRIEAEVAIVTRTVLKGPECDKWAVLDAIQSVMPAVEIIDSRYADFRFNLESVIADNTSAAGFVTGSTKAWAEELDLAALEVVLEKNGEVADTGTGAAVLGHPAESVAMLANMLADRNEEIPAGSFIMTGGITAAVAVASGDSVQVRYDELGTISMKFV
jgi:2-oxo-3-hexenedioate decarboxylase